MRHRAVSRGALHLTHVASLLALRNWAVRGGEEIPLEGDLEIPLFC